MVRVQQEPCSQGRLWKRWGPSSPPGLRGGARCSPNRSGPGAKVQLCPRRWELCWAQGSGVAAAGVGTL